MEKLGSGEHLTGDIFFFDYGAVVFWGLNEAVEAEILNTVAYPAQETPYDPAEVESDTFGTMWSVTERPNISNDTFTLSRRSASDQDVKISISHALAQSTKLCVYEKRISELVSDTKDFPEMLALQGKVMASRKQIAQLIGKVFIQKSQVNLLSTVLDTPEFFWSADDSLQALYKRVCEYLELDTRVEVLNNRYQVLTEMLNIVRDHENNSHTARLEWIVIWLIVIEVVVGLFECASILGWVGRRGG